MTDFMPMAEQLAKFSHCSRTRVGAVLVSKEGVPIGLGWNPGFNCGVSGRCERGKYTREELPGGTDFSGRGECDTEHAEMMALKRAPAEQRTDGVMYVTYRPCSDCAAVLAGYGIAVVTP